MEVLQPLPRDVIDFMVETTTSSGENVAIGMFLLETPVDRNNNETPGGDPLQLHLDSNSDSVEHNFDCERNVVYHKFNSNDDKVIFNWTTGDAALTTESNSINFR